MLRSSRSIQYWHLSCPQWFYNVDRDWREQDKTQIIRQRARYFDFKVHLQGRLMKQIPKIYYPSINGAIHQGHFLDRSWVLRVGR